MAVILRLMIVTCAEGAAESILAVINETNFGDGCGIDEELEIVGVTGTCLFPEGFDEEIVFQSQAEYEQC